ncbi:MAG: hypothetical protein JJT78_14040 [Leptospira sp.]|nr:hypothetical protein [Leptospira sp.]
MKYFPLLTYSLFSVIIFSCTSIDISSLKEKLPSNLPTSSSNKNPSKTAAGKTCGQALSSGEFSQGRMTKCDGSNGLPRNVRNRDEVSIGNVKYVVGFSQVTSNRQDAFAYKMTGSRMDWCHYYDQSPADTRGEKVAVSQDGSEVFVAFTADGGNAHYRATKSAVQSSYGQGGGPKVTFLARLDAVTGRICNGTYLAGRLKNNRTNTLRPERIQIGRDRVTFTGQSAHDEGSARDSISPGKVCNSGSTRTVIMPLNLTREAPYSASCRK